MAIGGSADSQGPPPGVSAAIHGFLYQILSHIDWAVRLSVTNQVGGASMHLEPSSGGDAVMQRRSTRIVEQYKFRGGSRTWSLDEIAIGPLADLLRAATATKSDGDTFRFVTDGRVAHHGELIAALDRWRAARPQSLQDLDASAKRKFRNAGNWTDRELFEWIQTRVFVGKSPLAHSEIDLLHLLSHCELLGDQHQAALVGKVDSALRQCLPDPGTAVATRQHLVGALMHFRVPTGAVRLRGKSDASCTERTSMKRLKRRVVDVVAVPLGNGELGVAQVLAEPLMGFFDLRSDRELSVEEIVGSPLAFSIWVMNHAVTKGRWPVIGMHPSILP